MISSKKTIPFLILLLCLGFTSLQAQLCRDFENNTPLPWGCDSCTVTTATEPNGNTVLEVNDDDGASWAINIFTYSGDITCKTICMDYFVEDDGDDNDDHPITPRIALVNSSTVATATIMAIYNHPVTIFEHDPKIEICIDLHPNFMTENWTMAIGSENQWNQLLTGFSALAVHVDWFQTPATTDELLWLDNICIDELPPAEPVFTIEDRWGAEKKEFCFTEDIYLDGRLTLHESYHFVEIKVINPQGQTVDYVQHNFAGEVLGLIDLRQFMFEYGNPSLNSHLFLPGYTYVVKFAPDNACHPWVEAFAKFTIKCCDSYALKPYFDINAIGGGDHYSIELTDPVNPYWEYNATHTWYVYSSPNQNGGPYTPEAVINGLDFFFSPAKYDLFYFVTLKVSTPCGDYCSTRGIWETESESGKPFNPKEIRGCELIDKIFVECDLSSMPTNLEVNGTQLCWDPVIGATSYRVDLNFGYKTSCKCEEVNNYSISLPITSNNCISIPWNLRKRCFEWTVTAYCGEGVKSETSEPACYGGERESGGKPRNNISDSNLSFDNDSEALTVFPNPVIDQLNFSIALNEVWMEGFEVVLTNASGQQVRQSEFGAGTEQGMMAMDQLSSGYYLMTFIAKNGQKQFKKVVVAK